MLDEKTSNILNKVYKKYDDKCLKLVNLLSKNHNVSYSYSNYYLSNNENKTYYPLPIIEINNLCLLVFRENEINILSSLSKTNALNLDYDIFLKYDFDIYPINDYYDDLYIKGMPFKELINNINKCKVNTIGYTFVLSLESKNSDISKLIKLLENNKFKYKKRVGLQCRPTDD